MSARARLAVAILALQASACALVTPAAPSDRSPPGSPAAAESDGVAAALPPSNPADSLSSAELPRSCRRSFELPEPYDALTGTWRGQWEATLDALVVPMEIVGSTVTICYAWGTNLNVPQPGDMEITGYLDEQGAHFDLGYGNIMTLSLADDGSVLGTHRKSGEPDTPLSRAVFRRVDARSAIYAD